MKQIKIMGCKKTPHLVATALLLFFAGCLARDEKVSVQVDLITDDPTVSIRVIHFVSERNISGTRKPPKMDGDGFFSISHFVGSYANNYIVVELLKDGEIFQTEVYELFQKQDDNIVAKSEFLNPKGIVESNHEHVDMDLLRDPTSVKFRTGKCYSRLKYAIE